MPEVTSTPAAITGPAAFKAAGITPADIDVAEIYDSFTITTLMTVEDLGFCQKGEGGPFVGEWPVRAGRRFPDQHPGRRAVLLPSRACSASS